MWIFPVTLQQEYLERPYVSFLTPQIWNKQQKEIQEWGSNWVNHRKQTFVFFDQDRLDPSLPYMNFILRVERLRFLSIFGIHSCPRSHWCSYWGSYETIVKFRTRDVTSLKVPNKQKHVEGCLNLWSFL